MGMNAEQHPERQRDDGDERAPHVHQEEEDDDADDDHLLDEGAAKRFDGCLDEPRAIVGHDDLDPVRETALDVS